MLPRTSANSQYGLNIYSDEHITVLLGKDSQGIAMRNQSVVGHVLPLAIYEDLKKAADEKGIRIDTFNMNDQPAFLVYPLPRPIPVDNYIAFCRALREAIGNRHKSKDSPEVTEVTGQYGINLNDWPGNSISINKALLNGVERFVQRKSDDRIEEIGSHMLIIGASKGGAQHAR